MGDGWLGQFKPTISSYDYYIDFDKAVANAQRWKPELHLMNSPIGSKSIESDFMALVRKYPDVLNVVPTLIAVRATEVPIYEAGVYYKEMVQESQRITGFQFVWVTDNGGWRSARNNLRETFEVMETIYNLAELEGGAFKQL